MAICEFAPGSPWNAIFSFFDVALIMAPCISRSGFCQYSAGGFEVGRGVDAARHGVDDGNIDPHARLDRPQLFELFLLLPRRGRESDKALQRGTAIGIEADMV